MIFSKIWRLVLLAVLVIGCGARPAGSQSDSSTAQQQQQLQTIEQHWLESEDNPAALQDILADDFIHVWPTGFVTKQQQIDFVARHPGPKSEIKHFEDLCVRIYGTVGIVNGVVVAQKERGAAARKSLFTDVFAFRNGRWQAVNAQELSPSASFKPSN